MTYSQVASFVLPGPYFVRAPACRGPSWTRCALSQEVIYGAEARIESRDVIATLLGWCILIGAVRPPRESLYSYRTQFRRLPCESPGTRISRACARAESLRDSVFNEKEVLCMENCYLRSPRLLRYYHYLRVLSTLSACISQIAL